MLKETLQGCTRRCALLHGARAGAALVASPLLTHRSSGDASPEQTTIPPQAPGALGEALSLPSSVGGVRFPESKIATMAAQLAFDASPPALFNHVMRTYLFGALALRSRGVAFDDELAFLGAALHDLGLVERFTSKDQQFELDGADAAKQFLLENDVSEERAEVIWDAVAMHTTGWLAARKRPEIAMVSAGAFTDVGGLGLKAIDPGAVAEILDVFPRLDFKRSVVDSMISFCKRKPEAVVLSQFAETGRSHIAGYNPPILEYLVLAAPFDS